MGAAAARSARSHSARQGGRSALVRSSCYVRCSAPTTAWRSAQLLDHPAFCSCQRKGRVAARAAVSTGGLAWIFRATSQPTGSHSRARGSSAHACTESRSTLVSARRGGVSRVRGGAFAHRWAPGSAPQPRRRLHRDRRPPFGHRRAAVRLSACPLSDFLRWTPVAQVGVFRSFLGAMARQSPRAPDAFTALVLTPTVTFLDSRGARAQAAPTTGIKKKNSAPLT